MIKKGSLDRLKTLWPVVIAGGVFISAAFALDWIGLSAPGKFSTGQVMLLGFGLLILIVGLLGRWIISIYKGAALFLLNAIIVLVCLELAAAVTIRAIDFFPDTPRPETELSYYRHQEWAEEYWREFPRAESNRYAPWVMWRRRPFNGNTINVNEEGLRVTPGAECGSDAYKVFAFGGSTMWGEGAPDWATIPAYLQEGLASARTESVCVINFGEAAFVSTQGVIELLLQLRAGNIPHLVIFYDGINDVIASGSAGKAGVHQNLDDIALRFKGGQSQHPLLLWLQGFYLFTLFERFTLEELTTRQEGITFEELGVDAETLAGETVQTYLGNYEIVDALAQSYGFDYYFFWQPAIMVGDKPLTPEEEIFKHEIDHFPTITNLFEPTYRRMEKVTTDYPHLYYIADIFDEIETQLWIEHTHITPEGNKMIAERMLEVIRDSSLQTSK